MPISEPEWTSIHTLIEQVAPAVSGRLDSYFFTGKVIKRDEKNKCVYLKEFGDQPIPLVYFDFEVKYYDETPKGTTSVAAGNSQPHKTRTKTVNVTVKVPKVGQSVLVVRELGTRRLPRCLGVIQGKNWISKEPD